MKSSFTTKRIILQREEKISIKEKVLEEYQKNIRYLQVAIDEEKEYLASFKKNLEVIV